MVIPELKREMVFTPVPQVGLNSGLKRENILLTDSLELDHKEEAKGKVKSSTFMDYYNSQPVKAPSNILERYIKRKK